MADDKEFLKNPQDLPLCKRAKKDVEVTSKVEDIALKDKETTRENDEIAFISKDYHYTVIDVVLLRFPHLGQQIFEQLDSNNLARCAEVNRPWQKFLNDEKLQILSMTNLKRFLRKKDLKHP